MSACARFVIFRGRLHELSRLERWLVTLYFFGAGVRLTATVSS
jgi:hypothetical protein